MYILLLKYCNIRYVFFILCGNKDYYYYYYYDDDDLCTNATYVGFLDVDTLFTTAVTPSLILEDGKPVVTGRIGDPRIPCWIESAAYILGRKQVMQCMHYFPVTFKTAHIREFR